MRVSWLCAGLLCLGLATIVSAAQFGPPGGGRGGRFGPGEPAQPGQVLPTFLQEQLKLTDAQRGQLKDLQKDVDTQLSKILTTQQRQQLQKSNQRGPGGFGPPQGGPPNGAGGPGGAGGPPQPGQILPTFLQEALKLTDEQRQQLKTFQEEVDTRLAKILTEEHRQQLQKLSQGGPGGGGPGGGGPGGPSQPGQIVPTFLQEAMKLTEAQQQKLKQLQDEVDARLAKILTAMQQQQIQQSSPMGPGGGPPGASGGFGPPSGFGPPGGQRGFGGPPQVGQVLSPMVQNQLKLSGVQRRQVKELQKTVDTWLAKILTVEQRRMLLQPMGRRGPGGPGF